MYRIELATLEKSVGFKTPRLPTVKVKPHGPSETLRPMTEGEFSSSP
jgi:hypothetical protein